MSAPSTPTDQEIPRGMPIRNTPPKRPRLEPKTNGPQGGTAVPLDTANAVQNYFSLRAAALPAILPHGGPPAPINAAPPAILPQGGSPAPIDAAPPAPADAGGSA